jgi:hypothetical protein
LLLVRDTQALSKTVFKAEALVLPPMVETQPVIPNLVLVVLVVIFLHGLASQQQPHTKAAVVVVLGFTRLTGVTQHQVLLLAV